MASLTKKDNTKDIISSLYCPKCLQGTLDWSKSNEIICQACNTQYPLLANGLPILIPQASVVLRQTHATLSSELQRFLSLLEKLEQKKDINEK